jgi:hypothetical protein
VDRHAAGSPSIRPLLLRGSGISNTDIAPGIGLHQQQVGQVLSRQALPRCLRRDFARIVAEIMSVTEAAVAIRQHLIGREVAPEGTRRLVRVRREAVQS